MPFLSISYSFSILFASLFLIPSSIEESNPLSCPTKLMDISRTNKSALFTVSLIELYGFIIGITTLPLSISAILESKGSGSVILESKGPGSVILESKGSGSAILESKGSGSAILESKGAGSVRQAVNKFISSSKSSSLSSALDAVSILSGLMSILFIPFKTTAIF